MKTQHLLFLVFFCLSQNGFTQDPVYVNASEIGNGIGFERLGESFILTPTHVVDSSVGDIMLSDSRKSNTKATLLETYSNDIAILRIEKTNSTFLPLTLSKDYNDAIENASSGFVAYLDALGIVNYVHVNITSKDQSSFTVTPQSNNHTFKKGMSGSPFYVMHNGVKTLSGMLMSIEEGSVDGFIYQWDDIITTVASFIADNGKKKSVKLGLRFSVQNKEDLSIIKRIISAVKEEYEHVLIGDLPEREFFDKHLETILEGNFYYDMPTKVKNTLDQLLLGKVSVAYDHNEKNMQLVYITFDGGLYSSEDARVLKFISITAKGLGYKKASAKEQAIKSILTKIKEQLHEN